MNHRPKTNEGFALLVTLVVVSVVLAIGLSLLFVTTRQYVLAVTANESEKAFQTAQIGLECLRYHRAQPDTTNDFLRGPGGDPTPTLVCAGATSNVIDSTGGPVDDEPGAWLYRYAYRFNLDNGQCTEPSLYIADLREYEDGELTLPVPEAGLPNGISCTAGTVCTAIFSRGYNRPCDQLDSIFSIQREITTEY